MINTAKLSTWTESQAISIKKLVVESGKLHFTLIDGREVIFQVKEIPEIKKLTPAQRKKVQVTGQGGNHNLFSFVDSEVIFKLTDDLRIIPG